MKNIDVYDDHVDGLTSRVKNILKDTSDKATWILIFDEILEWKNKLKTLIWILFKDFLSLIWFCWLLAVHFIWIYIFSNYKQFEYKTTK